VKVKVSPCECCRCADPADGSAVAGWAVVVATDNHKYCLWCSRYDKLWSYLYDLSCM